MKRVLCIICFITLCFPVSSALTADKLIVVPLGKIVKIKAPISWKGQWDEGAAYKTGDGLQYSGSSYICTESHTASIANAPPNASFWSLMASEGSKGEKGDTGATGPQGPQGVAGPVGPQGEIGPQGPTGSQGPQGIQGATGSQGPQGDVGVTGPQGEQGSQGPQGVVGPAGPRGLQGEQGIQGLRGIQGVPGPEGPDGPQGPQGIQGTPGHFAVYDADDTLIGYYLQDGGNTSLHTTVMVNFKRYIIRFTLRTGDDWDIDKAYTGYGPIDLNSSSYYYSSSDCTGNVYVFASNNHSFEYGIDYGLAGDPSFGAIDGRTGGNSGIAYYLAPNTPIIRLDPAYGYEGSSTCVRVGTREAYQIYPNNPTITGYQDSYRLPFRADIAIPPE